MQACLVEPLPDYCTTMYHYQHLRVAIRAFERAGMTLHGVLGALSRYIGYLTYDRLLLGIPHCMLA